MATESDLRDLLKGPEPEGRAAIDLEAVLRDARARRRPRVVAASALGAFALVGVLTPAVVLTIAPANESSLMVADSSAGGEAAPVAGDSAYSSAPSAKTLNACGGAVADLPADGNLELEVTPLTADAGAAGIPIEVTLRNTGDVRVTGTTASAPVIVFAANGTVLWHTNGATDSRAVIVDLAPGAAMTYATTFEPVVCAAEDDVEGFREDLPAAGPGDYRLSAAIDFTPDDGTAGPVLVTGPAAPIELR